MKLRNLLFSFGMILALPCMLAPQTVLSSDASEYTFTTIAGSTGGLGAVDAAGQAARFSYVGGVAVDSAGNVYVADSSNHTIRKLTPAGEVTTLAGLAGTSGSADGTGSEARFNYPQGVALDGADNLYVADVYNHTIRKITPAGVVTTIAGLAGSSGSTNGTGSSARFNGPFGVAVDGPGNIYVADCYNHLIRKISPAGEVTTLAGSAGNAGSSNGTGGNAKFYYPQGVAVDDLGNVFVADLINNAVRKITSSGVVSTFAGSASASGSANGTGTAARFYGPTGIAIDSARNLYVAEYGNNTIRKISSAKVVSTIAGKAGAAGYTDGIGTVARFDSPRGIALDQAGSLYVADSKNAIVRKITPEKVVITLAGLANASGATNGPSSTARFYQPLDVAADGGGNLYVADTYNHAIRKITPAGAVITLAGVAGASGSANGAGSAARFNMPFDLTVDGAGNVFVADTYNHAIRKITPAGVVATFAGLAGKSGSTNGTASIARFNYPTGVAIDGAGNMYVADQGNHTIRKITPAGVVTTLAGLAGKSGSTNGTGSEARFYYPQKIAVDDAGNLYVVDKYNQTIRKITPAGVVTTLAGLAGASGSTNGTGSEARFYQPSGITVDNAGNVYVADTANHTIRKITPEGVVTTISGLAGSVGSANGTGSAARFYYPSGVAVDRAGNLYVADALNNSIRKGNPALSDLPVVDQSSARAGLTRYLSVTDRTTTSQTWSVIRRPVGSSAQFSSATSANPTFIPDAPGLFIFQFSGTDAAGQVAIRTVEFQALPSAPAVAVTSHANLEQVTIPNIVLAGTVSDAGAGGEGVATVTVNGVHAHNDTAAGTGTANWSLPVSLNLGTNILAIAAKDTLMNATNFNLRIVRVDYKSPALAVTSHTPGQAVNTATLVLAGTACDAGLSESGISFVTVNGARAANDNASGANAASWSRSVKLVLGANKLAVVAADGANNKTTNNLVVYLDTTRPVVKITSPVSGRRVTNSASFLVTGTNTDNVRPAQVLVNPNKTGWQTATGTNAWQFEMPLITGTNSISACAVDAAGNRSSTNTVSLINVAAVELPVALDGKGGVTPVYTGQLLEIGRRYTLTAKPNAGHLFAGWSGGTNASAAALTFTMRAGLQLTASFTSNYFPSLKGAYNGLFLAGDAASVTASNSGFFSLTLGSTGSFTGRLLLAGATRNFSAAFNPRNKASFQIAAGSGRPALQMQLELAPASATVTGVVAGATWTASVDSVRAYAGAADPYAGRYTKVLAEERTRRTSRPAMVR